jgi:hypothetical protein
MSNLREINLLELNMAKNGINDMEDLRVAGLRAEVRLLFDDMPELGFFENLELMCDDVVFFEALANCTRNNVLAHQATIYKLKNARKQTLTLEIENLKMEFDANKRDILRLERDLSDLEERERKDELEHYRTFSVLNSERITPYFMALVKNTKAENTTADIKDDNGVPFASDEEQTVYVQEYYKKIHKLKPGTIPCTVGSIEQFLGEINNNPEVIGSKLSEAERRELDCNLTVAELDVAINQCNMKSAPGADGFSNKFFFFNRTYRLFSEYSAPLQNLEEYCYYEIQTHKALCEFAVKKGYCWLKEGLPPPPNT